VFIVFIMFSYLGLLSCFVYFSVSFGFVC